MKTCSKCFTLQPYSVFAKNARNKRDGLHAWCRSCNAKNSKLRYHTLPKVRERMKAAYEADKEHRKQTNKIWRLNNREYLREYNKIKKQTPANRKREEMRKTVKRLLKNPKSKNHILGCSGRELIAYIESLWKDGMSWENKGFYGWHIDHKLPISSFDLSDPEQIKKCFNYTNLQPLWAEENLAKGDKIV